MNIYQHITQQLFQVYERGEAQALSRIVVEDILGLSFTRVMAGLEGSLEPDKERLADETVARLLQNEPIQHIVGSAKFCGHVFRVSRDVLIPRPETEQLVEIAVGLGLSSESLRVMDACTGSGCIGVSIKLARPQWQVEACDISDEALQIASENAQNNGADVLFSKVNVLSNERPMGQFDLIVSNPPYVMNKEKSSMKPHVLEHEPHLALFVEDDNPLVFYQALAEWGRDSLVAGGYLAVEINSALGKQTSELFADAGYGDVRLITDMFDHHRFVVCRK